MEEHLDDAGTFIGHVLANLVERVTALEQGRRPRLRPSIQEERNEPQPRITKAAIEAEMVRLFVSEELSPGSIGLVMGYTSRTVRNHLKRAGVYALPAKKETT